MKSKGIQRIKAWTVSRFRRPKAAADSDEGRSERGGRLKASLQRIGRSLAKPRGRVLVRGLMFAFLVGAAYGLFQGSQMTGLIDSNPSPSGEQIDTVTPDPTGLVDLTTLADESVFDTALAETGPDLIGINVLDTALAQAGPEQPALPAILDLSEMVWPVVGGITGNFGWYRDATTSDWHFRPAMVIRPDRDPAPVRASLAGEVVEVGTSGVGYKVVLEHPEGWQTVYVGLSALDVTVGSQVQAGDTIGQFSQAPHRDGLEFMVVRPSGPTDPGAILYTPVSS